MQFERLISVFEADLTPLERAVASGIRLVDRFEAKIKSTKFAFGGAGAGTGFSRQVDREMRAAEADIRRFERERARMEREYTRQVERESRQREATRAREQKRAANDFIAHSRRVQSEEKKRSAFSGFGGRVGFGSALAFGAGAGAALGLTTSLASIAAEGREAYVSLDKLVRFTSTLDQSFQAPAALSKLKADIEALSLEVPQSAENIAKASFSIKSAFQDLSEPQLIEWLRKFSVAATASNTTVDLHADRLAALAKLYKVTAADADQFFAVLKTSFGDALSQDAQVAEGFQRILVPARQVKQSFLEIAVAMGSIQSATGDAEGNTTNLLNVYAKLGDPKYIQAFKSFGVEVFDQQGNYKQLNQIVNEVAKSLEGLTDAQKAEKLGKFRDLQFRAGLMSLLEVLDQYNARLANASDMQAFENANKVMLDSAEARWIKFTNKVEQIKREIGQEVANVPAAGADSETALGSTELTMVAASKSAMKGVMEFYRNQFKSSAEVNEMFADAFGFGDPVRVERFKQQVDSFFASAGQVIDQDMQVLSAKVLASEKLDFTKILDDPRADATLKEQARNKVESLNQALTQSFTQMDPIVVNKLRLNIGDQAFTDAIKGVDGKLAAALQASMLEASKGLGSIDPIVRKKAETSIAAYRDTMAAVLQRTDLSPEFRAQIERSLNDIPSFIPTDQLAQAGITTGTAFTTGVQAGIVGGQPEIGTAAAGAMPESVPGTDAKGHGIGYQFAMGVAAGIRSGYGPIGTAIAGAITWAVSSGEKKAEQQSPSRLAARELGVPFVQGIAVGMVGPKAKAAIKQSIKQVYDDLVYEAGRIDPEASKAKAAVERFYSSLLMDQSVSFDEQIDRVVDYYNEIYRVEADSYRKRLDNITRQEDAIRQRKDIKAAEKDRMLRDLADKRADESAGWADTTFNLNRDKNRSISDISQREIERAMAEFKRQMSRSRFGDIGVSRTAVEQATIDNTDRLRLIDEEIARQQRLRDSVAKTSETYAVANNKIIDLEERRKDAVVEGERDSAAAREADKQSLIDLQASIAEFANRSKEIEFDAAQAKIEVMRATGASEAEIFAAEQNLAAERENFRHEEFMRELARERDRLIAADTSGKERLRIESTYNRLLEAESKRHQGLLDEITSKEQGKGILEQWKQIGAQLPTYKAQLKQFAIDAPATIAGVFSQAISQMDGTWKGFLKSLKQAFFQTVQQMLAELFRVQLTKALTGLFSSIFGGLFGGGGGASSLLAPGATSLGGGGYAEGGVPPMNRVSIVGERGPELFVPARAGRILSNEDSKAAIASGGQGGSTVVNNTVIQNFKTPRALTAPRSVRQQAEAATTGLMMATQRR